MNWEKINIIIIVFCLIGIIGELIHISIEADYADGGMTLFQLEQRISEVKKENMLLKVELYHYESLTYIAGESAKLGFIPATDYIFIK